MTAGVQRPLPRATRSRPMEGRAAPGGGARKRCRVGLEPELVRTWRHRVTRKARSQRVAGPVQRLGDAHGCASIGAVRCGEIARSSARLAERARLERVPTFWERVLRSRRHAAIGIGRVRVEAWCDRRAHGVEVRGFYNTKARRGRWEVEGIARASRSLEVVRACRGLASRKVPHGGVGCRLRVENLWVSCGDSVGNGLRCVAGDGA